MIKPSSYWAMHKTCDPYTLGRVGATLGGQVVDPPLNAAENALVAVVRQDSEWYDERIAEIRHAERERKRAWREKKDASSPPDGKTGKNVDGYIPKSEPEQVAGESTNPVRPSSDEVGEMVRGAASRGRRPDVWSWGEDELRYQTGYGLRTILACALGRGSWSKAIKQVGEDAVRELFIQFRAEVGAGEVPKNAAAAFTARLKQDLGVDFDN